mmetsp:Transcript_2517/g.7564  ORF Transcript_2517/g.7564 Transcript_2517/m.7564 type:complete len:299 (+) Transcript_2517:620-1516(+)
MPDRVQAAARGRGGGRGSRRHARQRRARGLRAGARVRSGPGPSAEDPVLRVPPLRFQLPDDAGLRGLRSRHGLLPERHVLPWRRQERRTELRHNLSCCGDLHVLRGRLHLQAADTAGWREAHSAHWYGPADDWLHPHGPVPEGRVLSRGHRDPGLRQQPDHAHDLVDADADLRQENLWPRAGLLAGLGGCRKGGGSHDVWLGLRQLEPHVLVLRDRRCRRGWRGPHLPGAAAAARRPGGPDGRRRGGERPELREADFAGSHGGAQPGEGPRAQPQPGTLSRQQRRPVAVADPQPARRP